MGASRGRGETEANPVLLARAARSLPRLSAITGAASGRAVAMSVATATVGRHPTNDLSLPDPRVSGVHLELTRSAAAIHVRDVGSTNGTWLGPNRIFEATLAVGTELTVGDTVLRVDTDDDAVPLVLTGQESFGELVGASPSMQELFTTLERVAKKDLCVLIQGETGTGKEEVARAIHACSSRAAAPFVVIDATSLPETLAESLIFGLEPGALPGATERRTGYFEAARGGTVFIDEIGELPAALQGKFLRVLERREITRVGGNAPEKIDVRVLAATSRDLRNQIDQARFREDLYFRIAQVRVQLPPLRDRPGDIPLLCRKLLSDARSEVMIAADALEHLAEQAWPGNVRELKNALLRATALARDGVIRPRDVAGEGLGFRGTREERAALDLSGTFADAKERAIERFERAYLALIMKRCDGNLSQAAREASVARHHLRDLLKKRGLYGVAFGDEE